MKNTLPHRRAGQRHTVSTLARLTLAGLLLLTPALRAATIIKADNDDALNLNTSWVGGVPPTIGDIAKFDSTLTLAHFPDLGANTNWLGIVVANPGGSVTVTNLSGSTLTLGPSGIDMSSATVNLTLQCGITLSGGEKWNVAVSRTLDASTVTVGRFKSGTVDFSTTGTINILNPLSGGIVGPWATCGGDDWATGAGGGAVSALSAGSYVSTYAAGNNTAIGDASTLTGTLTTGTLKTTTNFDSTTACTLTVGGVMVPTGVTNNFSALGLKAPAGGELVIQGGGRLAVGPGIVNNATSSLTKSGTGTLIITNAGTYTGGTALNSGTLRIGNANTLGTSGNININGGTLDVIGGTITLGNPNPYLNNDFTFAGSGNLTLVQNSGGHMYITRGIRITVNAGTFTFGGDPHDVNGTGFTKDGPGTLAIPRASALNGGIVHMVAGVMALNHATSEGTGSMQEECIAGEILDMQGGTVTFTSGATNHLVNGLMGSARLNIVNSAIGATALLVGCNDTTYSGVLSDTNGAGVSQHSAFMTTGGNGTQTLSGANTYSGDTVICMNNGWSDNVTRNVLALSGTGSISNSPNIYLGVVYTNKGSGTTVSQYQPGAVFDVSGRTGGSYTVASGQTIKGLGSVNGTVVVSQGGTLSPGPASVFDPTIMGTQYYSNAPTLGGTVALRLYKSGATLTNDQLVLVPGAGALQYGGALKVTSIGDILSAGDKFYLFAASSFSASFATNLPALIPGLYWKTNGLTVDGSIEVASLPCTPPVGNVSGSTNITAGDTATIQADLTGTSPWNIIWSDGFHQSGITTTPVTRIVSPTTTTTYTLTNVTDSGLCTNGAGINSAVITVDAAALDHFTVVPSLPTALGRAFTVTVTGKDVYGNTELADSSTTVTLTSSMSSLMFDGNGDGNYGDNSATLNAGVAILKARGDTNDSGTITADDGSGHTGVSGVVLITGAFAGDYQSASSGNWSAPGTWQTYNGFQWIAATTAPTSTNGVVTIRNSHQVTNNASTTVDQVVVNTGGQLQVASGQTVTLNSNPTNASSDYTVIAQALTPPVIDGTVDAIWSTANASPVTKVESQVPNGIYTNASQCSGTFRTLYDADYLYVLAQVTDDHTDHSTDSSSQLFMNDAVEIYVDADNTKTTTYQFNDFHFTFSLVHGNTLMMSEAHNNTNGIIAGWVETGINANYVMEVAIPWSLVGQSTVAPGAILGFDVQIDHAYHGGTRDFDLFWHGTNDTDYANPQQFGVAILKGGPGADLDVFGGLRNAGTINGVGSLAAESGGQLSGAGAFNNANGSTVQSGAALQPGSAGVAGTASFGGALAFDTNALPTFDLSSNAGSGNDKVVLTGSAALSGNDAVVTINPLATLAVANYVLFDVQGSGSVLSDFNSTPAWSGTPPGNAADFSIITSGKQVLLHNVNATGSTPPTFAAPIISGGNIILTGSGGTGGASYSVVTSTNIASPLSTWTPVGGQSGNFAANGHFTNTIPVNASDRKRFYGIRSP
jgi:autotransporter-associated beta strand protein